MKHLTPEQLPPVPCPECGLPTSLSDDADLPVPVWTCDGPNDNTDQLGCGQDTPKGSIAR